MRCKFISSSVIESKAAPQQLAALRRPSALCCSARFNGPRRFRAAQSVSHITEVAAFVPADAPRSPPPPLLPAATPPAACCGSRARSASARGSCAPPSRGAPSASMTSGQTTRTQVRRRGKPAGAVWCSGRGLAASLHCMRAAASRTCAGIHLPASSTAGPLARAPRCPTHAHHRTYGVLNKLAVRCPQRWHALKSPQAYGTTKPRCCACWRRSQTDA